MKWLLCMLVLAFFLPAGALAEGSETCKVWINGEEVALMDTAVTNYHVWSSRPMTSVTPVGVVVLEGGAEVSVQFMEVDVESAVVRPLSLGIVPEIEGDTVRFTLDGPADVTVEYNGQVEGDLHLFLSEPDVDKPDPEDPNVLYFGPGEHIQQVVTPKDGQTVYLDEGCILRGSIYGNGVSDVRVAGRGIIDGSIYDRWEDTVVPINFEHAQNIEISGITILDPAAWTLNLYRSQDITVDGVHIIGARSNSDGITIQSCENVMVTDCFVRGWDDNLVVKGYDGDARDITFDGCVLWTDLAQSCEIGYETRADVIERITFRNITVLHNFHKPVMSIHNSDNALVRDILFENIVVEDAQMGQGDGTNLLIELTTTRSQWSQSDTRGKIRDVTFRNITVLEGNEPGVKIFSSRGEDNIDGVHIENLVLLGETITDFDQLRMSVNKFNGEDITVGP